MPQWTPQGYLVELVTGRGEKVRIPPFEAAEVEVGELLDDGKTEGGETEAGSAAGRRRHRRGLRMRRSAARRRPRGRETPGGSSPLELRERGNHGGLGRGCARCSAAPHERSEAAPVHGRPHRAAIPGSFGVRWMGGNASPLALL